MSGAIIMLHQPKFLENLGQVSRIATCFGAEAVWFSGDRINFDVARLPRELRMRDYIKPTRVTTLSADDVRSRRVPVAVEIVPGAQRLAHFQHPADATYVFGPEDGSIPPSILRLCHAVVSIEASPCLSLPVAVATVLYDRNTKILLAR